MGRRKQTGQVSPGLIDSNRFQQIAVPPAIRCQHSIIHHSVCSELTALVRFSLKMIRQRLRPEMMYRARVRYESTKDDVGGEQRSGGGQVSAGTDFSKSAGER